MAIYAYFGHHRGATLWTCAIVSSICTELDLSFAASARYGEVPEDIDQVDFLAHINADMSVVDQLRRTDFRAFHVIRDPRDVLISSYFSDKYSHPVYSQEFAEFRQLLNTVPFGEGLRSELKRRKAEFEAMATGDYSHPRIYETRFESLTAWPYREFLAAFGFMGMPLSRGAIGLLLASPGFVIKKTVGRLGRESAPATLPAPWLKVILRRNSFRKRAGRGKGREDPEHHYRKGVAGDWRNYLTGENKELFKDQWGQLLIDLGYEDDLSW